METQNIIYGLRDPRNDTYFYIGKSTVGISRPLSHLRRSHNDLVNARVAELRNLDYEVIIDIIEVVFDVNLLSIREKYWIEFYYESVELFNKKDLPFKHNKSVSDDVALFSKLKHSLKNYADIVKSARLSRLLSQSDVSDLAGISRSTLSLMERGEAVNVESLIAVMNALDKFEPVRFGGYYKRAPKKAS